ncbi:MAG: hypothetical protein ACK5D8_11795 [Bacteroidota bacterium]
MHLVKWFLIIACLFLPARQIFGQDTLLPISYSHIDDCVMQYPRGFALPDNHLRPPDSLPTKWTLSQYPLRLSGDKTPEKLLIDIFPVKEAWGGYDSQTKKVIKHGFVGAGINLLWKNRLHFFAFAGTGITAQAAYIDSVTSMWGIIPGTGTAKQISNGSYQFQHAKLCLSYRLHKYVTAELGYGKNRFGNGIRSLYLDDVASPYPYLRINSHLGKIRYTNLFCNFYDIRGSQGMRNQFVNKYAAMHYLSWDITRWLQFNAFEAIVFPNRNQNGSGHFFEPNYLNPLIFLRPVEYAVGSPDNSLLGGGLSIRFLKQYRIYANVILDEFLLSRVRERKGWVDNKQGVQAGIVVQQPMNLKNLQVQAEINWVRPYTYYHRNSLQNFAHMNQALAHALGANFTEYFVRADYFFYRNIRLQANLMYANIGYDSRGLSYGQNVYQPMHLRPNEFGNVVGQGLSTNLLLFNATLNWNPDQLSGLSFFASLTYRQSDNVESHSKSIIPSLGMRSQFMPFNRFF